MPKSQYRQSVLQILHPTDQTSSQNASPRAVQTSINPTVFFAFGGASLDLSRYGIQSTNSMTNGTTKITTTTAIPPGTAQIGRAFQIINQMVRDGVIENYAVGGATAAFFYIEPDTTFDVDIFCDLQVVENSALATVEPIYAYLEEKGYSPEADAVNIEGVAVQFLPIFNPLNEEAVEQATERDYQGVPVRVMKPEHLMAIMVQTGRVKDYVRVARFVDSGAFDTEILNQTLERHGLTKAWKTLNTLKRRLVR